MAKCDICGKSVTNGNKISIARSHVSRRAKRTWKPNLRTVRIKNRELKFCLKHMANVKSSLFNNIGKIKVFAYISRLDSLLI